MTLKSYLIALVVAIVGGAIIYGIRGCNAAKTVTTIERAADIHYDSTKHYRDKYNTEHAQKELVIADKVAADVFYREQMDSVCKRLHIKEKQLASMADVRAHATGTVTAPVQTITVHDTIPGLPLGWTGQHFTWSDSFLQMNGYIDSAKATVFYAMDLPIKINTFWKRRWFLGRKRYYIDGYSDNPNVNITGLTGVQIK